MVPAEPVSTILEGKYPTIINTTRGAILRMGRPTHQDTVGSEYMSGSMVHDVDRNSHSLVDDGCRKIQWSTCWPTRFDDSVGDGRIDTESDSIQGIVMMHRHKFDVDVDKGRARAR